MIKFGDVPYTRLNMEKFEKKFHEQLDEFKNAESFGEAYYALIALDKLRDEFSTLAVICEARNTMNVNDFILKFSDTSEHQEQAIFSSLFIIGNRLQTLFDNHITEISLKQFMLLSIIRNSKDQLTFTQLGKLLGCTRQNIKKLACVLEQRNYKKPL